METKEYPTFMRDWEQLPKDAKELSIFLAQLPQNYTNSDVETLKSYLGAQEEELHKSLSELSKKGLLTQYNIRSELDKVIKGNPTRYPNKWTPQQAENLLKHELPNTTLDNLHYRLVPKFEKFVNEISVSEPV